MIVHGGQATYGQKIGVLLLDSRIPRIPGDIGHAGTFDFPVLFKVVSGASIAKVIGDTDPALLEPFIEAARDLQRRGCRAITTSCGFLAIFQKELAAALEVPVFTSSLLQVNFIRTMIAPDKKIGIIAAEKNSITPQHLEGAGIRGEEVKIVGLDGCACFTAMRSEDPSYDTEVLKKDLVDAALRLTAEGDIGAIVVECTNLSPFSYAVQEATGLPVFDIVTLINYMHQSVAQRPYPDRC
ncbi:MAG: aspartate/glutamate racemase family protein [Lachnospiraceae bacterium]|nr:aspartate/glutamate racemase family protein [Lachnospiraceae bacterium]